MELTAVDAAASNLEAFLSFVRGKLSPNAMSLLDRAEWRFKRYEPLVAKSSRQASKRKNLKNKVDVEALILREVVTSLRARNKSNPTWSFAEAGLSELGDEFRLFFEYLSNYNGPDLLKICDQHWPLILDEERQSRLERIADEEKREERLNMCKPFVRPFWIFFVALCHSLHEGEANDLTATDAAWLGLIDEVIGQDEPTSLRRFVEGAPPASENLPTA